MAYNVCLEAALAKSKISGLDHSVRKTVVVVTADPAVQSSKNGHLALFAGQEARYDIIVEGTSLYKSANPNLTAVKFSCLLSPSLEVKAIQLE